MQVVLDTNALMMPVEAEVRLFEELDRLLDSYEAIVPEAVLAELEALAEGAGTEAVAASVGQDLAGRARTVGHTAAYADDAIVEVARDHDAIAVTNDRPLKRRLTEAEIPVIGLRGGVKLECNRI